MYVRYIKILEQSATALTPLNEWIKYERVKTRFVCLKSSVWNKKYTLDGIVGKRKPKSIIDNYF